jgi:hypothetical protein
LGDYENFQLSVWFPSDFVPIEGESTDRMVFFARFYD